ncbi:MAG: hypothetical protein KF901_35125 [Myxococcales bacterium]|nr:hypothetical protein [Myxococcales bacterium]
MRRLLFIGSLLLTIVSTACATEVDFDENEDDEEIAETEEALTNKSVSLKYEGTCEFLRNCSRWSRGLPEGNVLWGCSAENTRGSSSQRYGACEDTGLWVAGPTRGYCGKTAKICKGRVCVNAKVKDVSVSRDWEASNGVLAALNLPYGLTGRCSGYGGGRVTISTN